MGKNNDSGCLLRDFMCVRGLRGPWVLTSAAAQAGTCGRRGFRPPFLLASPRGLNWAAQQMGSLSRRELTISQREEIFEGKNSEEFPFQNPLKAKIYPGQARFWCPDILLETREF
jgi:hypothetical protein